MAEYQTIGLEVFLGMDSQQLQAELQKAENQLRQFQNQLKKSTDTQEITRLNISIANLNGTLNNIGTAMNNTAKKTGDATQSLINLSRVAQDAPYGFIGIANNLNPMLESFQRLQKETGSTTSAIKTMISGLTGPAGLGLALGVISSLVVAYSKEIAEFFKGPTEKLKAFREEIKKTSAEVYKIVGEAQTNRTIGLNLVNLIVGGNPTQQEESLKRLKALYSDNKAIQDAKIGNDRQFYTNLVNLASKQEEYAGKEKNVNDILEQAYTERAKLEKEKNAALKEAEKLGAVFGFSKKEMVDTEKQNIRLKYDPLLAEVNKKIIEAKQKQLEFSTALTAFETPDKKGKKEKTDNTYYSNLRKQNNLELDAIKKRAELGKTATYILGKTAQEEASAEKKRQADIASFGKTKMTGDFGESLAGKTSAFYEEQKKINEAIGLDIELTKKQTEENLKLADVISNYATNAIMGLWDALEQGQNIGEAIGNVFKDLAKQIAAAAIKAAIFQAIMAAISGGGSAGAEAATAATGGFMKLFKGFLGLATGGIVTKPTLAMVGEGNEHEAVMPLSKLSGMLQTTFNAGSMSGTGQNGGQFVLKGSDLVLALQRSNNNLNLRRGV